MSYGYFDGKIEMVSVSRRTRIKTYKGTKMIKHDFYLTRPNEIGKTKGRN